MSIALVDSYCDTSKLDEYLPTLLELGQEFDPSLEEVSFLSIAYSGDSSDDYYGAQVYTVQLYAGDNDVFIQTEELTQELIDADYCVALDTLDYFEDFTAKYPEVEILWSTDEATGEKLHAYAIDTTSLTGFLTTGAFDVRNKYAMISLSSGNVDTSFKVLTDLYDVLVTKEESAE